MVIDYKNIPNRPPRPKTRYATFDTGNQPRWNIPEACVIKVAVVGRPASRKGSPVSNLGEPPTDAEMQKIVDQNMRCIEAGACCVHYHAVGETPDDWLKDWHRFVEPIKKRYGDDVIFDFSLCTRGSDTTWEDEAYIIKEMAGICEFTPVNMGARQPKELAQAEVQYCQEHGVKPEIACYVDGDIDLARNWLLDTGIAQKPTWWDLLPSYRLGGTPMFNEFAMAETLMTHVREIRYLEPSAQFMVTGSGRASTYLVSFSMLLGLHIKVGMEDCYYLFPHRDDVLEDNVQSVKNAVAQAKLLGRRPATANEFRAFAGMPTR